MRARMMCRALGMLMAGISSGAQAQSVFNIVGPYSTIDRVGDADNTVIRGISPVGNAYLLGGTITYNSATMNSVMPGTWAREARLRMRNSATPTLYIDAQPFTTAATYTTLSITSPITRSAYSSNMGFASIAVGTSWSVEFYEDTNNGTDGLPESTFSNLKFTLNSVPPAAEILTLDGNQYIAGIVGDPDNSRGVLGNVQRTYVMSNTIQIRGGTLNTAYGIPEVMTGDPRVRLTNSAYPTYNADVVLTAGPFLPWTDPEILTYHTTQAYGVAPQVLTGPFFINSVQARSGSTFNGLTIPEGSVWSYEVYTQVDRLPRAMDSMISNIVLGTTEGTPYVGATPPTSIDLGDMNSSTAPEFAPFSVSMGAFAPSQVKWFKFSIPAAATSSLRYIDIWTDYADGDNTFEGLEISLYRHDGYLMVSDLFSGPGDFSFISIGNTSNPRPPIPARGTDTASQIRRGWHRAGLPAGTYYVAVGPNYATYSDRFSFVAGAIARNNAKLKFSTDIFPNFNVTGTLELQDTAGGSGNETIYWKATDGAEEASGSVVVDGDMGGTYNISLPGAMTGTVRLTFKGGTFLAKTVSFTGGSNATGQNASCMNGDINQDGWVNSIDFETVLSRFGSAVAVADCDNDGEVGASDFDIVVGNFGEGDN